MYEKTTNLTNGAGPGRNLQPGTEAEIVSGPYAHQMVRIVSIDDPDLADVELLEESASKESHISTLKAGSASR